MRLENKMHKWLKFIIKLLPFLYIFYIIFAFIGSDLSSVFATGSNSVSNWFSNISFIVSNSISSISDTLIVPDFILDFNDYIISNLPASDSNENITLYSVVLCSFEWFIFVDFIDLMLSAFRFIIDIARSWLDGFYTRSKRGGK